jgi:protein-disulfide isomerase
MGEFQSCVDSDRFVPVVNDNRQIASDGGVNGTPTFFANDNEIVGAQPFAVFQREIEAALSGS